MATTSETASVAPEAITKRGMRMSWFATKSDHLQVGLDFETTKDAAKSMRTLGQLVGVIWAVEDRPFIGRDAEGNDIEVRSLVAVGDFEAVKYSDGEVATTPSFQLPKYYLEAAQAALAKGADKNAGLEFAIEIVLTPTGKQVPTAYEVRNLIPREVDSPVNRLKQKLAEVGRLRLPPPVGMPVLDKPEDIEGQFRVVEQVHNPEVGEGEYADDQSQSGTDADDQAQPATPAAKAKGAK